MGDRPEISPPPTGGPDPDRPQPNGDGDRDNFAIGWPQAGWGSLFSQWLGVSDARMAEIIERVRAELPTTSALLIGKPQAGKSSIVRGLTGVSAEIVGRGFRPYTQHTERYAYPSGDLPLLLFTDTVGLGDAERDDRVLVGELLQELGRDSPGAKIVILTVKLNDFATDTLRAIARQLRQEYPDIPCLLAVTCLHEVYPSQTDNHPPYPPDDPDVSRAYEAVRTSFAGLYDRALPIDFTLEEDGYEPTFYGLEALRDSLAEMLPEAEARAIAQLLDSTQDASRKLGSLYRETARRYLLAFSIMAAAVSAVPLPFATMPALTALQISMVGLLGKLYGQTLTPAQVGGLVSTIAGGFVARTVGRELLKFIPGFGSAIAAWWAAAYTWALGEGACVYFGDLMGGKTPDPARIQRIANEAFTAAKQRFKSPQPGRPPRSPVDGD